MVGLAVGRAGVVVGVVVVGRRAAGCGYGRSGHVLQCFAVQSSDLGEALAHQRAQVVAWNLFDERCGERGQVSLAFQRAWIGFFAQLLEEVVGQWLRVLLDAGAKGVGALGADQGVRIFAVRQEQEACAAPVLQVRQCCLQCAPGGLAAGGVAVEAEQHAGNDAKQALEVFLAGGGAQGGDGVAQTLLGQGDDVHVALDHHDLVEIAVGLARFVEAVELLALVEYRGLRRVEIFGLVVAQHPAAKGDHPAAAVADGEHHAVAKAVVALAVLGVLDQQACIDQRLLLQGIAAEMLHQVVPAGRREAQAEVAGDDAGQSAALEVFHRGLARRVTLQRLTVIVGGGGEQRIERRIDRLTGLMLAPAVLAGDFHAGALCQLLDRLGEVQLVVVHDEAEGVAAGAAAKAVVELFVRADAEGRRLFLVERAEGAVVLAGLLQLDARTDHLDDVGAVEQVIDEGLGDQSGHRGIRLRSQSMRRK